MDQWGWTQSVILKLELVQIGLILVYVHVYRFQFVESRVEANLTLPSHPLCAVDFTQRGPRQGEEMQWPMFPITNFLNQVFLDFFIQALHPCHDGIQSRKSSSSFIVKSRDGKVEEFLI
jgi:hypothetical protein